MGRYCYVIFLQVVIINRWFSKVAYCSIESYLGVLYNEIRKLSIKKKEEER